MNSSTASREVSPIYEVNSHNNHSALKNRKMSTGGNRSWSEEEEAYLLRTRAQKMPYKHIAQHLKKTELACRLHYHQLSHGSHRRRRSSSVASSISSCSRGTTPSQYSSYDTDDYASTAPSRQMSPISSAGASPRSRTSTLNNAPTGGLSFPTANPHRSQKPLLPKPLQQPLETCAEEAPLTALRINTNENRARSVDQAPTHSQSVDTNRLRSIYEAHRAHFWASIASEYGSDVSAAQLEHVWRQGGSGTPSLPNFSGNGAKPPTPDASPDSSKVTHSTLPRLSTNTSAIYRTPQSAAIHSGITPASSMSAGPLQFHLPQYSYPSSSAIEASMPAASGYPSYSGAASAISAPDYPRAFTLPPPSSETRPALGARSMSRSSSSGPTSNVPATKIAAILTEDREPRPETESPKPSSEAADVTMRDA